MGGCATKPATLESEEAPAPVEAPAPLDAPTPVATEEAETVPQENENVGETNKEEPLVDLTEPTTEAPKTEEVTTIAEDAKPATEEAVVPATEEAVVAEPKEAEVEAKEEKEEVQETEAPKETEVAAPKSEEVKDQ